MSSPPRSRAAFTLIELLVVIAIIAVLIGLLLPAVQKVREAANRAKCSNNLHQIGTACHNYHDANGSFPVGWTETGANPNTSWAWSAFLLPYMEQGAVFNNLNPTGRTLQAAYADTVAGRPALTGAVSVYVCPSDTNPAVPLNDNRRFTGGWAGNVGLSISNYVGNYGPNGIDSNASATPNRPQGIFIKNDACKIRDIVDGTTSTFLAGERSSTIQTPLNPPPTNPQPFAAVWAGNDNTQGGNNGGDRIAIGRTSYRMNDGYTATGSEDASVGFASRHPGGCNFVLCDGSVRFVRSDITYAYKIDPPYTNTYNMLGDRSDGGTLGSDF